MSAKPRSTLTATDSVPLAPLFAFLSAFSLPERLEAHLRAAGDQLVCRGHDLFHQILPCVSRVDLMEESAALESLHTTMADGGV